MVNKLLVFSVCAIVAQSSVLLTSASFESFPQDGNDLLDQMQSEDLEARAKFFHGFSAFFHILTNGTDQGSSYQDLSPFAEALTTAARAIDIIYNSALLVSRGDCTGIDVALNESRAQLHRVIETYVSTVALALQGGNYDKNRDEIESNRNSTQAGLVGACATLFDFHRCCISDSSYEFESLLEEVQQKVNEDFAAMNDAIYEAIGAVSTLASDRTEEEAAAALLTIEKDQLIVLATAVDIIEHIYAVYETTYVVSYLGCDDITRGVFIIRLTRKRASDKLEETMDVVFIAIAGRLFARTNHHQVEINNSNLTDPSQDIAVSLLQAANYHFLEAVLLTLSNSMDEVTIAKRVMPEILRSRIGRYYEGMDFAEDGLPANATLLAFEFLEEAQTLVTNFAVEKYFEIIGSDAHAAATLPDMQNRVKADLQQANDAVFGGIKVLFEVAHADKEASEDDFNEVYSHLASAIAAVRHAARVLWRGVLNEYLVENGY